MRYRRASKYAGKANNCSYTNTHLIDNIAMEKDDRVRPDATADATIAPSDRNVSAPFMRRR